MRTSCKKAVKNVKIAIFFDFPDLGWSPADSGMDKWEDAEPGGRLWPTWNSASGVVPDLVHEFEPVFIALGVPDAGDFP